MAGLIEHAVATQNDREVPLIREVYDTLEKNVYDPEFKDIFHQRLERPLQASRDVHDERAHCQLGRASAWCRTDKQLVDHCLEQLLHVFAKDEQHALLESVGPDDHVIDETEGRVINPGHTLESMWFCIEEGKKRRDRSIIERAIQIADWAYEGGYDTECGGIFSYLDCFSGEPKQMDWYKRDGIGMDGQILLGARRNAVCIGFDCRRNR